MEGAARKTWGGLYASRLGAEVGERLPLFGRYGVEVVGVGDPPPVPIVVVVGATVVDVVVELRFVVVVTGQPLHPLVPLFLGSTPTARRAKAKTPTATAPRIIFRRRLAARSPLDPLVCSVEVTVSSAVSSVGCYL